MSLESKTEGFIDRSIRKGNFIGIIVVFLRKIGLTRFVRKVWIRSIYARESRHVTEEMKNNKLFFDKHKLDIERNINLLFDEKSKEVYRSLINFRCTHKLSDFPVYNIHNQYFDKDIVPIREDYVFADGGSFTGDTVDSFLKFCDSKYKKIICFEPDPENIKALKKYTSKLKDVNIICKGMWNEKTSLRFSLEQTASKISNEGEISIEVTSLDMEEICKDVNFIKMDIEGAELNALKGSIEVIKRNRPILAICIYHSNEDMINIIDWISELDLNYKFFVRHHSFDINETVMYAIPD